MLIYNSLTSKKEILIKPRGRNLNLFVCGLTVYDLSHIGHAKTYIAFDVIVRYLRMRGFKIFYLQNITDVDDKIIERAKKSKKLPQEIARQFEKEYQEDMERLGIKSVDRYARASDFIGEIQKQIKALIDKGFAYKTGSGVYFEVKKFKKYGDLSRQNLKELRAGWRIEPDPKKKDPLDFALWKISKEEPHWPSPWGNGRPGWHIEDTAITEKFFGPQYDLHGGAVDLKFPHHESEIAQQEAASGKDPFVKIWLHTGFLLVKGEKMGKSLKNFITIRDFLKDNSPAILRFLITAAHYRSPINFTPKLVEQARGAIGNIAKFLTKLNLATSGSGRSEITNYIIEAEKNFCEAMDNDFNTPEALSVIFALIHKVEKEDIWSLSKKEANQLGNFIKKYLNVLGIEVDSLKAPENIRDLVDKREFYRKQKKFTLADELRSQIKALGYEVEDTPAGPLIGKI